ncbi:MAG: DedA family protein [Mycobacteriaceae bacterium]|nr:DedA family protein [Mycobacteriaceae bacterium]
MPNTPYSIDLGTAGPAVVWLIVVTFVFLECALIIGLFLPGDSLLITAGMVLASGSTTQAHMHIWALSAGAMIAAVAGNQVGYVIGKRTGDRLVARKDGKYLNAENLRKVAERLHTHGFLAVLLSRWIPWVRTLCPMVAGAAGMNHRTYTVASTLGAVLWAPVLLLVGFYAGHYLQNIPGVLPGVLGTMVVGLIAATVIGVRRYRQELRRPAESVAVE